MHAGVNMSIAGGSEDADEWLSASLNGTTLDEPRSSHEYRLLRALLTSYEPAVLPSFNTSHTVVVKMGIALFQIRELVCCCIRTFSARCTQHSEKLSRC